MHNEKILNCTCIETKDGNIFRTLVDFQDPNQAISYLKYYKDSSGTREKSNGKYSSFRNQKSGENFVMQNFPKNIIRHEQLDSYVMIPGNEIEKVYNPTDVLRTLMKEETLSKLHSKIFDLVNLIIENCNIPIEDIGISGSTLVGLESNSDDSDIDLLIYGRESSLKMIKNFNKLVGFGIEHYSEKNKGLLIPRRHPDTIDGFNQSEALRNEFSKTSGQYLDTHFNISLIRKEEWRYPKIFSAPVNKKLGFCVVEAIILDDSEGFFVPPLYEIEIKRVITGNISALEVQYIIGSRFLHAQIGEVGKTVLVAGILQRRILNKKNIYVLSLEPWETVAGFIHMIE